jgi:hypothetical protein
MYRTRSNERRGALQQNGVSFQAQGEMSDDIVLYVQTLRLYYLVLQLRIHKATALLVFSNLVSIKSEISEMRLQPL